MIVIQALAMSVLLGLAGLPQEKEEQKFPWRGWAQFEERACARLIYFTKTSPRPWDFSPGQLAIEYGTPPWKDAYANRFDELTKNNRWRLGMNYWTNLDSTFPFRIGSKRFSAGHYYVAVERQESADKWSLLLLDPKDMIERRMDAWHINRKEVPEGSRAPLKWEQVEEKAAKLKIVFHLNEEEQRKALLEIRFGPHRLTAPVEVEF